MKQGTTEDLINETVSRRVRDIKNLIELGSSKEAAIAAVRESSTLGSKSWEKVLSNLDYVPPTEAELDAWASKAELRAGTR